MNIAYKVFSVLLNRQLIKCSELILGDYQCGFRPGISTIDQIFSVGRFWKEDMSLTLTSIIYLLILKKHMTVLIERHY